MKFPKWRATDSLLWITAGITYSLWTISIWIQPVLLFEKFGMQAVLTTTLLVFVAVWGSLYNDRY